MDRIRFGGMASGLDTEGIVKKLISAERMKVDQYHRKKTRHTWKQEQFHELNKSFAGFIVETKKKLGLTTRTSSGVIVQSNYDSISWMNKATISDEKVAIVKVGMSAAKGKYSLEVEQLAEGVKFSSKGKIDAKATLGSKIDHTGLVNGELKVVINDKEVRLKATDNMSQVAKKIRDVTGINANFDSESGKFFLSTSKTGSEASIQFGKENDTAVNQNTKKLLDAMNLSHITFDGSSVQTFAGKNAKIKLDGSESIEYQSNQIVIMGLDLTLKTKTAVPVEIDVTTDTESVVGKIKEFVEEYNKVIDSVNKKLTEKQNSSYQPLTDEQREAMKDKDIELWEKKAKEGLLNSDPVLLRGLQDLRNSLYKPVYDVKKNADDSYTKVKIGSLYELGLDTTNWRENGKLTIDEEKLKTVIRDDPQKVMKILLNSSDIQQAKLDSQASVGENSSKIEQNKAREDGMGIFVRIHEKMTNLVQDIVLESGPGQDSTLLKNVKHTLLLDYVSRGSKSRIDRDILDFNKIIDEQNRKLEAAENRYWKKFTALEKAIQQMQSQSGWIAQQMGGMMG